MRYGRVDSCFEDKNICITLSLLNVRQPLSDKSRYNVAMNRFLFSVLARNVSFLAVTFIPSWNVTVALPFSAERLWWVILLV